MKEFLYRLSPTHSQVVHQNGRVSEQDNHTDFRCENEAGGREMAHSFY